MPAASRRLGRSPSCSHAAKTPIWGTARMLLPPSAARQVVKNVQPDDIRLNRRRAGAAMKLHRSTLQGAAIRAITIRGSNR